MPALLGECDLSSLQNERALADEHLTKRKKKRKEKLERERNRWIQT